MGKALVAATAALLAAPALAGAASEHAADIAAALGRDPVYVAPARAEKLPVDAAGRIRLRILRKDIGRVKVAVVPGAWAASSGGARELANAVDAELGARGALLIVADRAAHVVTSHDHADAAASGVGRAFGRGGSLEDQLRRAVDALAEADPGPSGDVGRAEEPGAVTVPNLPDFPDANKIVDTVNDGLRLTFLIVAFAILAPISSAAGWPGGARDATARSTVRSSPTPVRRPRPSASLSVTTSSTWMP